MQNWRQLVCRENYYNPLLSDSMITTKNVNPSTEEDILEQINKIVLLKIKTLIVKNLRREDIPEFERAVKKNDIYILLAFARRKIPHLSAKIYEEMKLFGQKIAEKNYA